MTWIRRKSNFLVLLLDLAILTISLLAALLLRFDLRYSSIPAQYLKNAQIYGLVSAITTLPYFAVMGLYRYVWRYIGAHEVFHICLAATTAALFNGILSVWFHYYLPCSVMAINFLLQLILYVMLRYSYRILLLFLGLRADRCDRSATRLMIIGAGAAGRILAKEYSNSKKVHAKICCFIDDNPSKKGKFLEGIPILGGSDQILCLSRRLQIQQIVLAIPSISGIRRKELLEICKTTGCAVKTVPGMYQLLNGEVRVSNIRDVEINDLLGREPITVDLSEILDYVKDQVVMVTGGGGSIGSELCRQLATHSPKQLIIVDIYENNAYQIQQELVRRFPKLDLQVLIASVRDWPRMEQIFETFRPDLVYHAAAHKHVPLMEDSPNEAIKNNVFGTYNTAKLATQFQAKRFVLISTDKAVNPTNIMGASKRLCEMVIQSFCGQSATRFAVVRFGNVLGSNGSVIPLFKKQIEEGGPVTVTHPDIIRYFMTIPEAVSLVLQAGAYASVEGNIFILDMGTPIKIDDLARNLISLSGMIPGVDIDIRYTGLRPGEKLYEELLMSEEGLRKTPNQLIYIAAPIQLDRQEFLSDLEELYKSAQSNTADICARVAQMVPTFRHRGRNEEAASFVGMHE